MEPMSIGIVVGALASILGLFWLMIRMSNSFKDRIEEDFNEKLKYNKEYIDIKHGEAIREIEHIKEVQEGRLRELAKKIDELREQVASGQKQTMEILTKLLVKDD